MLAIWKPHFAPGFFSWNSFILPPPSQIIRWLCKYISRNWLPTPIHGVGSWILVLKLSARVDTWRYGRVIGFFLPWSSLRTWTHCTHVTWNVIVHCPLSDNLLFIRYCIHIQCWKVERGEYKELQISYMYCVWNAIHSTYPYLLEVVFDYMHIYAWIYSCTIIHDTSAWHAVCWCIHLG